MSQTSKTSISRQINSHLAVISLVFVLLISLVFSVIYFKDQQNQQQNGGQLTQLKQQINYQQALIKTSGLLEKVLSDEQAGNYQQYNQQLIAQWSSLNNMLAENSTQFELWLSENKKSQEGLNRIVNRSAQNKQLLTTTLEQLQLITEALATSITKKNRQLQQLYQLILQDNVNDSVTVNRAKSHTNASTELENLKILKQHFDAVILAFEQLNIKTSSDNFESLNQQVVKTLALHEFLINESNGASLMFEVNEQVATLQLILLTEQRTIAKWRGYLRLINEYRMNLQSQYQTLMQIIIDEPLDANVYTQFSSERSDSFSGMMDQKLTAQQQVMIFWLLFCILALSAIYLMSRISQKLKVSENTSFDAESGQQKTTSEQDEQTLPDEQESQSTDKNKLDEEVLDKDEQKNVEIEQDSKLKESINTLESELIQQNKNSQKAEKQRNKQLNEMLIKTMVESQDGSSKSNPESSLKQVYRQLNQMLDWLRQRQLVSHLQISAKALSLSDINLYDEIHAAIINAMSEAQGQQNQILLNCDQSLTTKANLDARLFQRLIKQVCQLSLKGQKNAFLAFSITVIDKNAGQQVVKITAELIAKSKITVLPKSLSLLIASLENNNNEQVNESEYVSYFKALLTSQHGTNLNSQLSEQGFILSFELPLTLVSQSVAEPTIINLKKASTLLITGNKKLAELIGGYIKAGDGILQSSSSSTFFVDDLTIDELKRRPLKVVILAGDCYQSDFDKVKEHIASLPKEFQPKLMVLQDSYQAPLQSQGFYHQGSWPLSQSQFLTQLQYFIANNDQSNLMIESQQCQKYQYQKTQIEVLLAVKSPEQHLPLLRILHWLGLQVQVVSQAQAMKKHWQSGRYLVLLNEFSQSPFIEMIAGKLTKRGVFGFAEITKNNLSKEQLHLSETWQVGRLPSSIDLAALTSLLSPWLKAKAVESVKVKTDDVNSGHYSDLVAGKSDLAKVNSIKAKMASVVKDKKLAAKGKSQACFDMDLYTKHQGTSELAIYMLDEYMESNDESFTELSNALKAKDKSTAEQALMVLMQNARILAADDLIALCLQLEKTIAEQAFDKAAEILLVTDKELKKIKKYASSM